MNIIYEGYNNISSSDSYPFRSWCNKCNKYVITNSGGCVECSQNITYTNETIMKIKG